MSLPYRFLRIAIFLATALVLSCVVSLADDFESGRQAANRGEFSTALSLWKPLADAGDERAQVALGRMYARGDGVHRDLSLARRFFESAAQKQFPPAYLFLGKIYFFGDGVTKDLDRAFSYFSKASAGGIAEADTFLKKMKGHTVHVELPTPVSEPARSSSSAPEFPAAIPTEPMAPTQPAEEFIVADQPTAAASTPTKPPADPLAPYRSSVAGSANLGSDHRSFRFDPVAETIIRSFPGGLNQLSTYASALFYGPLVLDEAALSNHLAQANAGSVESQNIMGFAALYAGNRDIAQGWLQRSAQAGNGIALFALGNFAYESNYERAFQLYQEAASKGVVAAKRNLGYFLLRGIGVDQNRERGKIYLADASKLGDTLATDLLK